MRARGEGDGRMLLGDNIGERVVMLRSIRFHCFGIWISVGHVSV